MAGDRVELSGDHLTDARVGFDQNTNEPIDSFRFDSAGTKRFAAPILLFLGDWRNRRAAFAKAAVAETG